MPRPKGSKNRKPAACHKPRKKSQFANTEMANKLHADFCAGRGAFAYEALRIRYNKLFDTDYFCLIDFDTAWHRLLKKVKEVHGIDYHAKYTAMDEARRRPRSRRTDDQKTGS